MNTTDFQALTVISGGQAQIDALPAGTYFLFASQEWQKGAYGSARSQRGEGTDLRHKVHYQRKVDAIDAYGITGPAVGYVPEYDLLEADIVADETKTVSRIGKAKKTDTISDYPAGPNKFSSVGEPPLKPTPGEGFRGTGTSSTVGDNTQDGPNSSRDDDARHDVIDPIGKWS